MSVAEALSVRMRDRWATRFVHTADITRITDRGPINVTTNLYDAPTIIPVQTALPGLWRPLREGQHIEIGSRNQTVGDGRFFCAWDTTGIQPDDILTLTSGPEAGLSVKVVSVEADSYRTNTTLFCQRNEGPGAGP